MKKLIHFILASTAVAAIAVTSCGRSRILARDIEGRWQSSPVELTLPPDTAGFAPAVTVSPVITFVTTPGDIGGTFVMQAEATVGAHTSATWSAIVRGTWTVIGKDKILIAADPDAITRQSPIDPDIARQSFMAFDEISGIDIADDTMTGRISGSDVTLIKI